MALRFGTSGVRGLVEEITDRECFLYTVSFIRYLRKKFDIRRCVIGGDLRASTPKIKNAIAFALSQEEIEIEDGGNVPTPALVYYGMQQSIPGMMVTGSHIPEDRNGIKFTVPWGEIVKEDEAAITEGYQMLQSTDHPDCKHTESLFDPQGRIKKYPGLLIKDVTRRITSNFMNRYIDFFPKHCLDGLTIVHYQHSSVGRESFSTLFSHLGAKVIDVGHSLDFIPVDTEAVSDEEKLSSWVKEYRADALVSSDGDSDRPLLVDETGEVVRGDIMGVIVAKYLGAEAVSVPVSCNTALERSENFGCIRRTRIGSPYVVSSMLSMKDLGYPCIVGYEANGGFLTATDITHPQSGNQLKALPTRDAVLPLLSMMVLSQQEPISHIVQKLSQRYTYSNIVRNVAREKGQEILAMFEEMSKAEDILGNHFGTVSSIDSTDGVRIHFDSGDIVHFRPSGNAPEFRCYTESDTNSKAKENNRKALSIIFDQK